MKRILTALIIALGFASAGFANDANRTGAKAVFVMTNAANGNEIIAYHRANNGTLREERRFYTGGRGSGGLIDPLASQGSLTLSQDHSLLFAVNAGSGDISVFRVHRSRLFLVDVVPCGGSAPNAIAQRDNLVYVLNTAGSSSVVGFRLSQNGKLTRIHNSLRFLSTNASGAASLAFSPDGRFLLVTERFTNSIDAFMIQSDGTLSPIVVNPSPQPGTFAVIFAPSGAALVAETGPGDVQNGSTISSYAILDDGKLSPITPGVPTLGAATCWNAITPDGRFVYTDNAGSATISGFAIDPNGALTPLPNTIQATNPMGSANLDLAISSDGKYLYTLNAGVGTIGIFRINKNGSLTSIGSAGGIGTHDGVNGIVAL